MRPTPHPLLTLSLLALLALVLGRPLAAQEPPLPVAGVNLSGINYYTNNILLKDRMKGASRWMDGWNEDLDLTPLQMDANGYPTVVPSGWFLAVKVNLQGRSSPTQIVVTYEGNGSLSFTGSGLSAPISEDTSSNPRRIVYGFSPPDPWMIDHRLRILSTAAAPNHIRNIQVHFADEEPQGANPNPWYPNALDRLGDYEVLRFMDLGLINNSTASSWAQRATPQNYSYAEFPKGMPIEIMVDLCNRVGADFWLCLPHEAEETWVEEAAALIRQHLDPGRKVFLEWSNETWNPIFRQWKYLAHVVGQRHSITVPYPHDDPALEDAWRQAIGNANLWPELDRVHGELSARAFQWFTTGWGSGWDGRVIRALGTQSGSGRVPLHLEGAARIQGWGFDAVAVGAYFAHDLHIDIHQQGWAGAPTEANLQAAFDLVLADILEVRVNELNGDRQQALQHGLPVVAYEGGQHIAANGSFDDPDFTIPAQYHDHENGVPVARVQYNNVPGMSAFIEALNRHPRMYDMYMTYLGLWSEYGGSTFAFYNDLGGEGRWGVWGHIEYDGQPTGVEPGQAVKRAAIADWQQFQSSLAITTGSPLTNGGLGYAYNQALQATRGTPPYSWSVVGGQLPTGLQLSPSGQIWGYPSTLGKFSFRVRVEDSTTPPAQHEKDFLLTINPQPDPISCPVLEDTCARNWDPNTPQYGTNLLWTLGGPENSWGSISYFRASLAPAAGREVTEALLRVFVDPSSFSAGVAYLYSVADDTASFPDLTWNNRPTRGPLLTSLNLTTGNQWQDFDLTEFVQEKMEGNGIVTLALTSDSMMLWRSVTTTTRPEILVYYAPEEDPVLPSIPVSIPNHSFEAASGWSSAHDWTLSFISGGAGTSAAVEVRTDALEGKDGTNFASIYVENASGTGTTTGILASQPLGSFEAATTYELRVAVACDAAASDRLLIIGLSADGVLVDTVSVAADALNPGFQDLVLTVDTSIHSAAVGKDMRVELRFAHSGQYGRTVYFDDVRLTSTTAQEAVAPPQFSPGSGSYTSVQIVTLSTATDGATIRYTVDGSQPSESHGSVYAEPVEIGLSMTLRAMAFKAGAVPSSVVSAEYVIDLPPEPEVITVPNHSFEAASGWSSAHDWAISFISGGAGTSAAVEVRTDSLSGKHGTNFASIYVENASGTGTTTGVLASQPLGSFEAATTYELRVAVACDAAASDRLLIIGLSADGVLVDTVSVTADALNPGFQDLVLTLDTSIHSAAVGKVLRVELRFAHSGPYGRTVYFDDVRLTAVSSN